MSDFIPELQKLDSNIKVKQQKRLEVKRQVSEKIEQMHKEQEARQGTDNLPTQFLIEQRNREQPVVINDDDDEDFREFLNPDGEQANKS